LSKKGRNVSPKNTKILVTNLAELVTVQLLKLTLALPSCDGVRCRHGNTGYLTR
jgi:hypothetical protein